MRDEADVHPGDLCSHGTNRLPLYRVIAIDDGKAWVRDVNSGVDGIVEVTACHRVQAEQPVQDARPHTAPATGPASEPPASTPIPRWPDGTPRP